MNKSITVIVMMFIILHLTIIDMITVHFQHLNNHNYVFRTTMQRANRQRTQVSLANLPRPGSLYYFHFYFFIIYKYSSASRGDDSEELECWICYDTDRSDLILGSIMERNLHIYGHCLGSGGGQPILNVNSVMNHPGNCTLLPIDVPLCAPVLFEEDFPTPRCSEILSG